MAWTIEWTEQAKKELRKLDRQTARQVVDDVDTRAAKDPRAHGKALTANLAALWRYRVGDHRIVVSIQDERLVVLVVRVAHRREVYR